MSRGRGADSAVYTVLWFLNTTKYPPSLAFLLMTLGPALILLSYFDRRSFSRTNPLIVFGRVPLFYFVLHFIAAHLAAFALAVLTYGSSAFTFMWQPVPSMGGNAKSFPPDFGWDLWVAYAVVDHDRRRVVSAVPLVCVGQGAAIAPGGCRISDAPVGSVAPAGVARTPAVVYHA